MAYTAGYAAANGLLTVAQRDDVAWRVGEICVAEKCGVWHAIAILFDTQCHCVPCAAKRATP
jgi:hypothetical protein